MTFSSDQLVDLYPRAYHMAELGSWPSILKHGLLSTSALLDLFEISGPQRHAIEAAHRPEPLQIRHKRYGTAVIRDQGPMSDRALLKCLQAGFTPERWYRLLNRHVFFWLSRRRLNRLLGAKAYRSQRHVILEVETLKLVRACNDRIRLTPINTGSTIFKPQPRGSNTFSRISVYPYEYWRKKRPQDDSIVELAVQGGVRPIGDMVLRVTEESNGQPSSLIYSRA